MTAGLRFKWTGTVISIITAFAVDSPANAITAITKANPAVVTDAVHNLVDGSVIVLAGIVGMTELNGQTAVVNVLSSSTFELLGIDSTNYTAWASGGTYTIGTATQWCELTGYNRTGGSSPEIPATTICSTAKEYEIGLPDFGTTQFDYNFAPLQSMQAALKAAAAAGTIVGVKIVLPGTGGTMIQLGFVQQTSEQAANDGLWTGSLTLRNTGNRADFVTA